MKLRLVPIILTSLLLAGCTSAAPTSTPKVVGISTDEVIANVQDWLRGQEFEGQVATDLADRVVNGIGYKTYNCYSVISNDVPSWYTTWVNDHWSVGAVLQQPFAEQQRLTWSYYVATGAIAPTHGVGHC